MPRLSDMQYQLVTFNGGCVGKSTYGNDLELLKRKAREEQRQGIIKGFEVWEKDHTGFHDKKITSEGSR